MKAMGRAQTRSYLATGRQFSWLITRNSE